ncbi:MAG: ATP-binding cassette domain-containing protein [Acetatifactor sp.]|nr:ATP-binding cassette domain-containing protein [Acetatifactor sp.]
MEHKMNYKKILRGGLIVAFWLVIWTLAARIIDNKLLFVSPLETLKKLVVSVCDGNFWKTVLGSTARIGTGFLFGLIMGSVLAVASAKQKLIEELLSPVMKLCAAVPVASFVVILLIWWGSRFLAVSICFLVVLPIVYTNTLEGIKSFDKELLEMAAVFHIPLKNRLFYIYLPSLRPFLYSALKVSLGLSWKSGVAAEVIGIPDHSIGEKLYLSKVYLDTAGVFAWTVVVILLSVIFEKIILCLAGKVLQWQPICKKPASTKQPRTQGIQITNVNKSYGDNNVLSDLNRTIAPGETVTLREPSGSGKTTLLRLLAGLEKPDQGTITCGRVGYLFQEDRLIAHISAVKNVALVTGDETKAREALIRVLDAEDIDKPCEQLSGGMKRRATLVRAVESDCDLLLLDEPFNGLDDESREKVEKYMKERQNGRSMVIASHI